jgi:hypothetical protein
MPTKVPRARAQTMENKNKYSERREQLRKISDEVAELQKNGKIKATNQNDALLEFYSGKKKNQVWMTLEQWQTAGYSVRKGETSQMIWGKKVEKTNEAGEAFTYFPILFVFSNTQVERTVRNFNSAAAKSEILPQADVASALDPVTGKDLPF